jgi:RHS repeat-associated protein
VRRVFASASSAPAYGYDPYGNALQATAPLTDFGYAGMFTNADSGLYLTRYRAYDPATGRWSSRDPIGELPIKIESNFSVDVQRGAFRWGTDLYAYVGSNPISRNDPNGDQWPQVIVGIGLIGAIIWEKYEYDTHQEPVTFPPPSFPPGNVCTPDYPQGTPPQSVSTYYPPDESHGPEFPEPPEPPDWPKHSARMKKGGSPPPFSPSL